jgi:hypothetical protein
MNRKLAVTLIAVAFIFGIVGGGFTDRYYCRQTFLLFYASTESSSATSTLVTLKNLRANNATNALELLEGSLDGSLTVLDAAMDYIPKPEQDKQLKIFASPKRLKIL